MAGGARRGDGSRCSSAGQAQPAGSGAAIFFLLYLLLFLFFITLFLSLCLVFLCLLFTSLFIFCCFLCFVASGGRFAFAAEAPEAEE